MGKDSDYCSPEIFSQNPAGLRRERMGQGKYHKYCSTESAENS